MSAMVSDIIALKMLDKFIICANLRYAARYYCFEYVHICAYLTIFPDMVSDNNIALNVLDTSHQFLAYPAL